MQKDKYLYDEPDLGEPVVSQFNVTPDDSNDLPIRPRAIYVGVQGDVAVRMKDIEGADVDCIYKGAIGILPIRVVRVLSTGTTATNIIGLY